MRSASRCLEKPKGDQAALLWGRDEPLEVCEQNNNCSSRRGGGGDYSGEAGARGQAGAWPALIYASSTAFYKARAAWRRMRL